MPNNPLPKNKVKQICDIKERTFKAWAEEGLPIVKIRKKIFVMSDDLEEFMHRHRHPQIELTDEQVKIAAERHMDELKSRR